jgi:hypothetical protein
MRTHDQVVEELMKRPGVRVEVERLEGEIEALLLEEAEGRAPAREAGEIRGIPALEVLRSARSAE